MTSDRIALYILAILVAVLTGAFAWYAIGNDAAMERLREELAELKSESTNGMDGLFDLAKRTERHLYLLAAKVEQLENSDSPLPSDPVTYVMQRYPKQPHEV